MTFLELELNAIRSENERLRESLEELEAASAALLAAAKDLLLCCEIGVSPGTYSFTQARAAIAAMEGTP